MPKTKQKPAAAPAEPKPEPAKVPDWVNETPGDTSYNLTMFGTDGEGLDDIDLTRKEFIMLKRWLAAMRDYSLVAPGGHPCPSSPPRISITQEEMDMIIEFELFMNRLFVNLRERLKEGAEVEQGKWMLQDEGSPIELPEGLAGSFRLGLNISLH